MQINKQQKRITAIGFILLGLAGIISMCIAMDSAKEFNVEYYWVEFAKAFLFSFISTGIVISLIFIGIYILKGDK